MINCLLCPLSAHSFRFVHEDVSTQDDYKVNCVRRIDCRSYDNKGGNTMCEIIFHQIEPSIK